MEYAIFKILTGNNVRNEVLELESFINEFNETEKIERIYWGSELCAKLLPSLKELKQIYSILRRKKYKLTFVTPAMISGPDVLRIKHLLTYLNSRREKIEVVVNDLGLLELVQEYDNLVPLFGRLLIRMEKDPRVNYKKVDPKILRVLRSSALSQDELGKYLISKKIKRLEYDNVPQGVNARNNPLKFRLDLYYPYVLASLSRVCAFSSTFKNEKDKYQNNVCQRECLDYKLKKELKETLKMKGF
ncbi:MAG: hypothetical protein WC632_04105 [Candidatus Margulisiibacteriota bacterium]